MRRLVLIVVMATLSLTAFAGEKKSQKPYALIFGTVYGPDNHVLAGVPVVIRRADGKQKQWEHVSDSRGEFAQRVPAGKADYIVEPQLNDKQATEKARVTVHIQNEERQDMTLHLIARGSEKK